MKHLSPAALAAASYLEFGRKDGTNPNDLTRLAGDLGRAISEVKSFAAGSNAALAALDNRIDTLEQKLARSGGGGSRGSAQSPGQLMVAADEVKSLLGDVRGGQRAGIRTKAIISSATADADGSAGAFLRPHRESVVGLARRRLILRDLLPVIPVTTNSVEVPKQSSFTNNAATVAEGALKPQSEMKFRLEQLPIRTIAHWVLASRQILSDAPQLQGFIDSDLLYGLAVLEENQLLNGTGSGSDLNGIYTQATAFTAAAAGIAVKSGITKIDIIAYAILQNELADEPVTGVVMHPSDWTDILTIKDADGKYIMGPPGTNVEPRLFNRPVVTTKAMTVDKFLVGNFEGGATLYDREEARVEISTEDSDNFRKNLVTVLGEERIGLDVKRTTAFTKGDFSDAEADLEA